MKFDKPALSFDEQAALLVSRGLVADERRLRECLRTVSYFRLTGYLHPYKVGGGEHFVPGTTLDEVWMRYVFDRQLRLLALDAIERFEVDLRARLVTVLADLQGPTGYVEAGSLPHLPRERHAALLTSVLRELARSKEDHARHFKSKYSDTTFPPYWLMSELTSFGTLRDLYKGAPDEVRVSVAEAYGIESTVLDSWIATINLVRNICAHHGRLWNKHLGSAPMVPRLSTKRPASRQWHDPVVTGDQRIFATMTMLKYLVDVIAPRSSWQSRFHDLLERFGGISVAEMGFPSDWRRHGVWNAGSTAHR